MVAQIKFKHSRQLAAFWANESSFGSEMIISPTTRQIIALAVIHA
jgi:hypothetical protein